MWDARPDSTAWAAGPRVRIERDAAVDGTDGGMAASVSVSLADDPPWVSSTYFYDDRGSELFEAITRLPEYYPTRTEERLLATHADELLELTRADELVELGSGAGRKIRLLLDAMGRRGRRRRATLLDINERFLTTSAHRLAEVYPDLEVRGVVGDFTDDLAQVGPGGTRLFLFLAGTIGNLQPDEVPAFLRQVRRAMGRRDAFLVGVDRVKDTAVLEAAYNDAAGVTAQFNRNILCALNAGVGSKFDPDAFEHVAFWDPVRSWIEMRLRATRPMRVDLGRAGGSLELGAGDEIRTEISCKYTRASFTARLANTGLELEHWFTDPDDLYALALLRPAGPRRSS